jgi:hypothetical protein
LEGGTSSFLRLPLEANPLSIIMRRREVRSVYFWVFEKTGVSGERFSGSLLDFLGVVKKHELRMLTSSGDEARDRYFGVCAGDTGLFIQNKNMRQKSLI